MGIEGIFIRHGAQSKLVISVEMIQRSVSVNVAPSDVEPSRKTRQGAAAIAAPCIANASIVRFGRPLKRGSAFPNSFIA